MKLFRSVVVSLAMVACVSAVGTPALAAPEKPACPASAADAVSATAQAKECGGPVEVLGERTEYSQTSVNPNGTHTLTQYVEPRWAKAPSGQWEAVNTSLRVTADGVSPARTLFPVTFSPGGTGLLARLVDGDHEVGLTWPGTLPAPTLDGDTATYAEVLPGMDLQVTATATGFSHLLVVKNRAAAAHAALAKVNYGLHTKGVAVATVAGGGLEARTSKGEVVFSAPTPTMWDSSGGGNAARAATPSRGAAGSSAAASGRDEQGGDASKPGGLPRTAAMKAEVASDSLAVVPDQSMLNDPTVVFPVYIDPSWNGGILSNMWKNVASRSDVVNSTSFTLNNGSTKGDAGSGRTCDSVTNNTCNTVQYLVRSFFRMDISGAFNRHFISATFNIEQKHSWTCNPASNARLWVTGGISSSTTWNSQPSWDSGHIADTPANRRVDGAASCAGAGVDTFNATGMVSHALASGWANLTLGLRAIDESTRYQWKRFQTSTASLSIVYNTVPGAPANLSPHQGQVACGGTVGTSSPVLQAQFVDLDTQDTLTSTFAWEPVPLGSATRTEVAGQTRPANNNGTYTLALGAGAEGKQYRFQVRTHDGTDASPWSDWCSFTVDTAPPAMPIVTPTASGNAVVYQSCDPANINACTALGGPGVAGAFVLSSPAIPTGQDVVSYTYGWDSPSITVNVSPGAATTPILMTPPRYGLNHLVVVSKDGANKSSDTRHFYFLVQAPAQSAAHWPLDSIDGHGFSNLNGSGGSLTTSNVTWTPDARYFGADAATFANGEATQTISGFDTSGSFGVSAFVRLASTCASPLNQTAVAIDADTTAANNHASAFMLSYDCTNARWRLRVADQNIASPAMAEAVSANNSVVPGRWTHVVGTYDEPGNTVKLWLDGVLVSTVVASPAWVTSHGTGWTATGPVTIGRDRFNNTDGGRFAGEIADVRLWSRALVGQDVTGVNVDNANGIFQSGASIASPRVVGSWFISDGECFCVEATDGSGFDRKANLVPNWTLDENLMVDPQTLAPAWFVDGGHDSNGALRVDGVSGYASTATDNGTLDVGDDTMHPVVHTNQSLTFSAWVNLNQATSADQVVVSAGPVHLMARGWEHKWGLTVTSPNGSGGTYNTEAVSNAVAATGTWVHLVGVFNAAAGTVTLYVNGVKQTVVGVGAIGGGGTDNVTIGSMGPNGNGWFFGGLIDDVRIYQGALNDREALQLYNS